MYEFYSSSKSHDGVSDVSLHGHTVAMIVRLQKESIKQKIISEMF